MLSNRLLESERFEAEAVVVQHPAVPDEVRVESSEGGRCLPGERESPSSPESRNGPAEEGGESGPAVEDERKTDWLDGIDPGWRVQWCFDLQFPRN